MRVVLFAVLALALPARAQGALDARVLAAELAGTPHAEALASFYQARAEAPLWTTGDGLSDAGTQLVAALRRAGDDGLDPADYRVPMSGTRAAREAALATAFLAFCSDLMRGRVDPEEVHADWRASRRGLDAEAALRLAAARGPDEVVRSARPPHAGYANLRLALAALRAEARTPWPPLPDGPVLREGAEGMEMQALRDRLIDLGLLEGSDHADCCYDNSVTAAVRRFQTRAGIGVDGAVGPETRAALNVTPAERARQVALNLERWRWLPGNLGEPYVWIDAAAMTAAFVVHGAPAWTARVIVGTTAMPTPGFSSDITHTVLSAYWNVPASIARNEIEPLLVRDVSYLAQHDMERLADGSLRQRPGPRNPLGPVKFIFDTPFGVRLHGTPTPALFDQRVRTFSHGCIRLERPLELASLLLPS